MKFIDSENDLWHAIPADTAPPPAPRRVLSWEQWHDLRSTWPADVPVGLLLDNTLDTEVLGDDLRATPCPIALVVLQFPKWTDGRAYSQARLLRSRFGFRGEIRAIGDVLADMMPLLQRCGVDAVQLRADQKLEVAKRALGFFAGHYQGDLVEPRPLFARHAA
ncbi:MAG: DUF934 domain-containing protein [Rubrivivax sp.]